MVDHLASPSFPKVDSVWQPEQIVTKSVIAVNSFQPKRRRGACDGRLAAYNLYDITYATTRRVDGLYTD
jgi:hypothetical protein